MEHDLIPASSAVSPEFRSAVNIYASRGETDRIRSVRSSPRVKVLRVIRQLLEREPELAVERVEIDALSGCSDFRGTVRAECADGVRQFEFVWDCQWRAEQLGWVDAFAFPDQIRAAREFGWDCFRSWQSSSDPAELVFAPDEALST